MKYQYSVLLLLVLAATSFGEESVNGIYSGKQRVIETSLFPVSMCNTGLIPFPRGFGISLGFTQHTMHWGIIFARSYYDETIDDPLYKERGIFFHNVLSGYSFDWLYLGLLHRKWLLVAPGINAGIWVKSRGISSSQLGDDLSMKREYYFLGPKLHINVGYNYVFLSMEPTLLVGTGVAFFMPMGISARF